MIHYLPTLKTATIALTVAAAETSVWALSTSDPTVIAAAFVTVIAALVTGIVSVINAIASANDRKDNRESREVTKDVNKKADTIIEKAAEIHTLANSTLSKTTEALNVALEKNAGLEKMIVFMAEAKKIADTLAASSGVTAIPGTSGSLQNIDVNTSETAKNTARTEAVVKDLKDR